LYQLLIDHDILQKNLLQYIFIKLDPM